MHQDNIMKSKLTSFSNRASISIASK